MTVSGQSQVLFQEKLSGFLDDSDCGGTAEGSDLGLHFSPNTLVSDRIDKLVTLPCEAEGARGGRSRTQVACVAAIHQRAVHEEPDVVSDLLLVVSLDFQIAWRVSVGMVLNREQNISDKIHVPLHFMDFTISAGVGVLDDVYDSRSASRQEEPMEGGQAREAPAGSLNSDQ